ncbi:MAG: nucleoside kinase [Anaerolineae bacterium]|nr:nucleoside kinase [Anaerolineae bacterium]
MSITPASPRQTVQIRLPDGRAFDGPVGATIEQFMLAAAPFPGGRIMAALVNYKLRELSRPLTQDAELIPITTSDSDGMRIYRRSLSFLMIAAAHECFPDHHITVEHSLPFGGYYCEVNNGASFSTTDLARLDNRMRELVAADLPIQQVQVPLDEALSLFRNWQDMEKADLFAKRRKDYLTLYELNGVRDYFHGFMVPRTSYLDLFALRRYSKGFILQYPRRSDPTRLQPFEDEPRLAQVFQEYNSWLSIIGVPSVAALNRAISSGRSQEVVLIAEALHDRQLANIANQIADRRARVVLISGPTSAGKTTFSKRLAVQLMTHGLQPVAIGMDDYFINRELTPRDEKGNYDFETIAALDLPLFQTHLGQLLTGETIIQPRYNFHTGQREWGGSLNIGPEHVLLIEGIHGLNPLLVGDMPQRQVMYRIFISAFTQLNLDRHNRIPTTDTRLLRRIVRDAAHRGYSATDTIRRWPSVRRGEKRHIFPNQNNADLFFNSALVYELSVLKSLAEPLLLQVESGTLERVEANRLMAFLQWFDPLSLDYVPNDSILREFAGGSIMEAFKPWRIKTTTD